MARYMFGGGIADYVVTAGADDALLLAAGAEVTFWSAQSGGTRYTDLRDLTDAPITSVLSDVAILSRPGGRLPLHRGRLSGVTRG